ncbi:hypothetical protein C0583_06230 [Candidatus Parcubacteria bacterium]|nr:MAG: hypothetical protein C0583_06230 [Candidatus Parcubacteria bacterium]
MKAIDRIILFFFSLQILFWAFLGVFSLVYKYSTFVASLMFFNAMIFLVFAWFFWKNEKRAFWFIFYYVLINFILTFTDQFGVIDLMILVLNFLMLLGLFLKKIYVKIAFVNN